MTKVNTVLTKENTVRTKASTEDGNQSTDEGKRVLTKVNTVLDEEGCTVSCSHSEVPCCTTDSDLVSSSKHMAPREHVI